MTPRIEPFRPEDAGPLSAFRALFPLHDRERPPDYYAWKYGDGPEGAPRVLLAREGERIVGMHALVPRPALVRGERLVLHEFEDTYTHPDFQGQGIFSSITGRLLAEAGDLTFVVPNKNARPLWERKFGFVLAQRLVDLRVAFRSVLRGVSRWLGAGEGWPRRAVTRLPPGGQPWDRTAGGLPALCDPGEMVVRFLREEGFVRWRYVTCPLPRVTTVFDGAAAGAAWAAWLPTDVRGYRRLHTLDLGCAGDDDRRRDLAATVVAWARDAGADELRALLPEGDPWEAAFRSSGANDVGPGLAVYASPGLAKRAGQGRWWMRLADTGDM